MASAADAYSAMLLCCRLPVQRLSEHFSILRFGSCGDAPQRQSANKTDAASVTSDR